MEAITGDGGTITETCGATYPNEMRGQGYGAAWQQALADAKNMPPDHGEPGTVNAGSVIAAATDPSTGAVDTKALAAAVAQAVPGHMELASRAYTDIAQTLAARNPAEAQHFDADVRDAVRYGSDVAAGGSRGLSKAGYKLLLDNPILTKRWEATTSPWTGKGGFTDGLREMLESHGIEVERSVNPVPAGGLDKSSGEPQARANNLNGDLARDAIADRYRAAGARVATEVPTQDGRRVVDVRVDLPTEDPRNAERIDIESKLGRTSNGDSVRLQAAKDGEALAENDSLRGFGAGLETAGKVALPLAVAGDAWQLGQAFQQDGGHIGTHTEEAAGGIAGSWAGAEIGAETGAEIGSLVGPEGTVVGGLIGGVVGGIAGSSVGRDIVKDITSLF